MLDYLASWGVIQGERGRLDDGISQSDQPQYSLLLTLDYATLSIPHPRRFPLPPPDLCVHSPTCNFPLFPLDFNPHSIQTITPCRDSSNNYRIRKRRGRRIRRSGIGGGGKSVEMGKSEMGSIQGTNTEEEG